MAQRALDLLGDTTGPVRARLLAQQHVILGYADGVPFEDSDARGRAAMAMADELGDPALRGWCLRCRTMALLSWGLMDPAVAAGLEAADLLHAAGNPWEEAAALGFVQQALMFLGRFDETVELHRRVEPLAERFGNVPALLQTRRVMGIRTLATGDLDAFEEHVRADTQLCEEHGLPWVSNSHTMSGNLHFWRGDWVTARELYETAVQAEPQGGIRGWDRALLIEFHGYCGDRAAVLDMLDGPDDNRLPAPGRNQWGRWAMLFSAVEALVLVGERERAAALHDAVLFCLADTGAVTPSQMDGRLASRVAGISAFAAGRLEESEQHFRTALDQAERLPHVPEQAHTLRWYAQMLLERNAPGDREAAAVRASEAADLYRQMVMPRHLAMVEAML